MFWHWKAPKQVEANKTESNRSAPSRLNRTRVKLECNANNTYKAYSVFDVRNVHNVYSAYNLHTVYNLNNLQEIGNRRFILSFVSLSLLINACQLV